MAKVGEIYVFSGMEIALEWLVVNSHPDDEHLILMAPADDFPFVGTADVEIPTMKRPWIVRCGQTLWVEEKICQPHLLVDWIGEDVKIVKAKIANLARGKINSTINQTAVDDDPNYLSYMDLVANSCKTLQKESDSL